MIGATARVALGGAMTLAVGCRADDSSDRRIVDDWAAALCEARRLCDCPASEDACEDEQRERLEALFADADRDGLEPDVECIDRRLAGLRALECGALGRELETNEWYAFLDETRCSTFVGGDPSAPQPGPGDACEYELVRCNGDSLCVRDSETKARVCIANAYEGGPCIGVEAACASGLACIDGACTPSRASGEPCFVTDVPWNRCAADLVCVDGFCGPGRQLDEPCTPSTCAPELACQQDTEVCAPPVAMICADLLFP